MELDQVPGWIVEERLPSPADHARITDLDAGVAQLGDRGVEASDADGEVLATVVRYWYLDQMDLLVTEVEPGAADPEVGAIVTPTEPDDTGLEGDRLLRVTDLDRHVVHTEHLHAESSAPSRIARRNVRVQKHRKDVNAAFVPHVRWFTIRSMLRRLTVLTLALGLLAGACGDDDAGDDNAAVTSLPDDDTTTTTSTTEPRTVAPDVIPQDESLITEEYVEGVLAGLADASLEALLATRDAGGVDETAIALTNATSTEAEAVRAINQMAEVARAGFDPYHANPSPIDFEVQELHIATPSCIVTAVTLDLSPLLLDPPPAPPGQVFVELLPASEEQRSTGLNPTAWVLASSPVVEPGDATPDCEVPA